MSKLGSLTVDRRGFLGLAGKATGALAVGAVVPGVLTACGSSAAKSAPPSTTGKVKKAQSLGTWVYQLGNSWEAEFLGEAVAEEHGFFSKVGFSSVQLVPGSGSTSGETYVATHQGQVSITTGPTETAAAVKQGLPVRIVAVHFQKSPQAVISLSKAPITTAQELKGKTVGCPPATLPIFKSFLSANGLKPGDMTIVPTTFDPSPLATGQVQALIGYSSNQAVVLNAKGFPTTVLLFSDAGFPQCADGLVVTTATLANDRERLKAFLYADILGWQAAIPNLSAAVQYMVNTYGKSAGLEVSTQLLRAQAENKLMLSSATAKNGMFTLTQQAISQNMHTVELGGVTGLSAGDVFDLSALEEVYQEHPEIKHFSG